ncbi:uncharacterized protein AC631_04843 [Debaryomyces fabryi]|uniref:Meiotically up-regulated protein Msb1/Mug8 domain-containing protein n=1 Tax=Debaryomyces fabryi TaxID=58627 RepID=A0A0V1PTU1_9ASCO|nr:uncharacterized protein AC631_04843 [Debaryomyces fabryi]KRZ99406.1 hypothetical protein AC631_04843 [Debaryomyces fabryi]
MEDMELPDIPGSNARNNDGNIIKADQFTRKKLRGILHLITGELKSRGTKTPHIFLPFRSRIDDTKLEQFISRIFPRGELISMYDEVEVVEILRKFDEFTLICGLKYLWSRLTNNEIIGWDVYLEYKRKEKEAGYPKGAFLSIMPKCLSSPAHASIVYDFLDLLISIASNSQYNYLSGRKIAKMSSLWAFNGSTKPHQSPFYDATLSKENTFIDGLEYWKPSSEALFHLLLSFLRAMLPDNETDTLKLPKTLQSLLITNSYPPLENTDSIKSIITIPCVVIKSTKVSSNVYELLSKVRNTISFSKKDSFLSMENYTILKNIFQKSSTNEIVSSLTEESRRILTRLNSDPIDSNYNLYPGWSKPDLVTDPNIPLFSQINIEDVSLQDYYIWTWLSSLASDQTSHNKKLFGRSIVVEASLKGFQKWMIITEQVLDSEEYIRHFNGSSFENNKRVISNESYKNMPLPPPPPPSKDSDLLPKYRFNDDDFKIQVLADDDEYIYPTQVNDEELSDYRKYLESLSESQENELTSIFKQKSSLASNNDKKATHRPPPPPLDTKEVNDRQQHNNNATQLHLTEYDLPPRPYQPHLYETEPHQPNVSPIPDQNNLNAMMRGSKNLSSSSAISSSASQYMTPEGSSSPQKTNDPNPYYTNGSFSPDQVSNSGFKEPYENYETESERYVRLKHQKSEEPYDDYHVAGLNAAKHDYEEQNQIDHYQPPRAYEDNSSSRPVDSHTPHEPIDVHASSPKNKQLSPIPVEKDLPQVIVNHETHFEPARNDQLPVRPKMEVQGISDEVNENHKINDTHMPTMTYHDQTEAYSEQDPTVGDIKKEEKKKKKKHKKKKDQQSPTHNNGLFSPQHESFYGNLPPGPPPLLGVFPPGPPPPGPPPPGIIPPFLESNSSEIPPFFPPGPPPGMNEPVKEPQVQNKTKKRVKKTKQSTAQPQEEGVAESNLMPMEHDKNFNDTKSPQLHFDKSEKNPDTINPQPGFDSPESFQDQVKYNPRKMTPPNNYSEPNLQHQVQHPNIPQQQIQHPNIPQQEIQNPNIPQQHSTTPHIKINNEYQTGPQQARRQSPPQAQSLHLSGPKYTQQMPPNTAHGSRSVPHLMGAPAPHPGSQSAPHLPLQQDYAVQPQTMSPRMRSNSPYINGKPHNNNQARPPQGYPQNPSVQHQHYQPTSNLYVQPPPNVNYYQQPPNVDPNMGHYQSPGPMNSTPMHPQVYYPPGPQHQQYYPPPHPQMVSSQRMPARTYGQPPSNNLLMMNVPSGVKHKKNGKSSKADLRAAFNQSTFGI